MSKRRSLLLIVVVTVIAATTSAQVLQPGDLTLLNDLNLGPRPATNRYAALQRCVEVEREEIRRVCDLTPSQAANLAAVARLAVESALEDWADRIDLQRGPRHARPEAVMSHGPVRSAAVEHPVWRDAIEAILTDQQQEAWKQAQSRRQEFAKTAESSLIIAMLDRELLLSAEQREQWLATITPQVGRSIRHQRTHIELTQALEVQLLETLSRPQREKWIELKNRVADGLLWIRTA